MSVISHPVTAAEPVACLLAASGRPTMPRGMEDVRAGVQSGGKAGAALDLLAGTSRSPDASLATLRTVAWTNTVQRDADAVGDPQVVRALAGQCLVAAMLVDAGDPAGTSTIFRQTLCDGVRAEGTPVLDAVSAALIDAVATGRGELRLDQAVLALASFAQLGRPPSLEAAALSLARLPLSERTVIHLLRQLILHGPAEHGLATGALLLTFARARAMSDARLLAALADPDPHVAVRLLVALLGQNDAATANPSRPPLGWDVIAIGLHWLVAEGIGPDLLVAAVAAATVGLPDDLATNLRGMARKIALPSEQLEHAPAVMHGT